MTSTTSVASKTLDRKADHAPAGIKRVVAAAMAGAVAEWYEFFLYGTASALVFGQLFFRQTGSAMDGIIAAFALYAVGFLARPLGIGVRPLWRQAGAQAPAADQLGGGGHHDLPDGLPAHLRKDRLCRPGAVGVAATDPGLCLRGRVGRRGAVGVRAQPGQPSGYWASWPQAGVPAGNLIATVILLILSSSLSEAQFLDWGWRVAFWFSAVVVLIGYWIRKRVDDAPIFKEAQARQQKVAQTQLGVVEVLTKHWRAVLIGIGARFAENILYYTVVTFSITYLKLVVHKDTSQILLLMFGAHLLHFFMIPAMGYLSDIIGRKPVYWSGRC